MVNSELNVVQCKSSCVHAAVIFASVYIHVWKTTKPPSLVLLLAPFSADDLYQLPPHANNAYPINDD